MNSIKISIIQNAWLPQAPRPCRKFSPPNFNSWQITASSSADIASFSWVRSLWLEILNSWVARVVRVVRVAWVVNIQSFTKSTNKINKSWNIWHQRYQRTAGQHPSNFEGFWRGSNGYNAMHYGNAIPRYPCPKWSAVECRSAHLLESLTACNYPTRSKTRLPPPSTRHHPCKLQFKHQSMKMLFPHFSKAEAIRQLLLREFRQLGEGTLKTQPQWSSHTTGSQDVMAGHGPQLSALLTEVAAVLTEHRLQLVAWRGGNVDALGVARGCHRYTTNGEKSGNMEKCVHIYIYIHISVYVCVADCQKFQFLKSDGWSWLIVWNFISWSNCNKSKLLRARDLFLSWKFN